AEGLRSAALASGGRFYREEDLHRMASSLQGQKAMFTVRHETLLWNGWLFLLFVGLITGEWVLRKFSNLS
ncbi:MAG: hypothetical protein L0170_11700, partial [Acidobacteria bacterium]|nr:hypothetical protein [Acidobacteriota bacterium]